MKYHPVLNSRPISISMAGGAIYRAVMQSGETRWTDIGYFHVSRSTALWAFHFVLARHYLPMAKRDYGVRRQDDNFISA
jgi:hypothetical protein